MGAWGAGIFENDHAMDVRGLALDLMSLGLPPQRVSAEIMKEVAEPEPDANVWLGLAITQHKAGRVDDAVNKAAIELIDTGRALQQWVDGTEPDDKTIKQRERHLKKARELLSATAPAPKRLKVGASLRQRIDLTFDIFPWRRDGLYAYQTGAGTVVFAASVVQDAKQGRHYRSTADGYEVLEGPVLSQAILVLLDYRGLGSPTAAEARTLRPYTVRPSGAEEAVIGRSIEMMHAHAVANAAETFEVFCDRTRDMLGHFSPEQLRARYDVSKGWARENVAAFSDTQAAMRRRCYKRFCIDASDKIPRDRLIDLGECLDTEAAATAHDFNIQIEIVTWGALDKHLVALGFGG